MKPLRDLLLRDDLGPTRPIVEEVCARADRFHSEQSIPMACDWRVAIENTLEDAHIEHVHPDTIARLGLERTSMNRFGKNSLAIYDVADQRTCRGLRAIEDYFENPYAGILYFHLFLYPHTTLSSVGGFTYSLQHYFPTETGTVLLTRLYTSRMRAGSPDLGFFFDNAAKFNRQVFEEDARLCERIHLRCVGQQMRPALKRLQWFAEARNADKPIFFTTPSGAEDGYFYKRFMEVK